MRIYAFDIENDDSFEDIPKQISKFFVNTSIQSKELKVYEEGNFNLKLKSKYIKY